MRRCVRNEDDHLARVWPPVHVEGLGKSGSDSFGAISTSRRVQAGQVAVYGRDVRREAKILRDICVILRWMVTVSDEADSEVLLCLELARLEDVLTYSLNVLCCRLYVAALTARTVLYKD